MVMTTQNPIEQSGTYPLPEAQKETELISTTEFKARQPWGPETGEAKIRDSLKCVLTFEAADVPGSAFAPLAYDPFAGVAIDPTQTLVSDRTDRGTLTGSRKESVTYVFQAPGKVKLPDVAVTWWDITNKELKRERLQGRTLTACTKVDSRHDSTFFSTNTATTPQGRRQPL
jgi:hypothetical protein